MITIASGAMRQRQAPQEGTQRAAAEQQQCQAGETDEQRWRVQFRQVPRQSAQHFVHQRAGVRRQAQQRRQLREHDQHGRTAGEAVQYRPAEKIHESAGAQHGQHQQRDGRYGRQLLGVYPVAGRVAVADGGQRAGHHDGVDRYRADTDVGTGAEQGVGQGRQHAGIETDLRRQAGHHGIGHGLGNQQDGGDGAGDGIGRGIAAAVLPRPAHRRQAAGEAGGQGGLQNGGSGSVICRHYRPPVPPPAHAGGGKRRGGLRVCAEMHVLCIACVATPVHARTCSRRSSPCVLGFAPGRVEPQ
jgi:hypothetical protein